MAIDGAAESAEIVASIEHLLSRILLLLPVESLLRFKSVSKRWLALISNPHFCHLRNPNPNPASGLLLPPGRDRSSIDYIPFRAENSRRFEFSSNLTGFRILQSCNGLLLLRSDHGHLVYNPTTNSRSEIHEPGEKEWPRGEVRMMNLAFDPAESPHYTVVCVRSLETDSPRFQIGIYSSKTRSWQSWGNPFASTVNFEKGVYWNGAVHWLSLGGSESLYFRVADQVLDKMPAFPSQYGRVFSSNYLLGQSCGHLHLIQRAGMATQFVVYEMERDYSEWVVKYRADLSAVIAANREMVWGYINPVGWFDVVFCVLGIVRGKEEEDSFLVLQTPEKIIRYNLVDRSFENLFEFEEGVVKGCLRYPCVGGF